MHRLSETKLYDPENGNKLWQEKCENPFRSWLNMILTEEHFEKNCFFGCFRGAMLEMSSVHISMWWHLATSCTNQVHSHQILMALAGDPEAIRFSEIPICFLRFKRCTWSSTFKTSSEESRAWESWLETLQVCKNSALSLKGHKQTYLWNDV